VKVSSSARGILQQELEGVESKAKVAAMTVEEEVSEERQR
jgi:hypothetical protein